MPPVALDIGGYKALRLANAVGIGTLDANNRSAANSYALHKPYARRQRPRGRRTAEQRDELAPSHVGHGTFSHAALQRTLSVGRRTVPGGELF